MPATSQSIADQSAAHSAFAAANLPADVFSVFTEEQRKLEAGGPPADVAAVGTRMPDGELFNVDGTPVTLEAARGGVAAVIVFYRGAWCPYCNIALRTYEKELAPSLKVRGVRLIAISPQKSDGSLSIRQKNELTFETLSDPGNRIASALGIVATPSAESRGAQGKLGLDIREHNADGTAALPLPTVVLVDASGTIRWIDVHSNYATRTEVSQIESALALL